MTVEFDWLVEPRLLLLTYSGVITEKDMESANKFMLNSLRQHPEITLQTISDISKIKEVALEFYALPKILNILRQRNFGWMVVVGLKAKSISYFNVQLLLKILPIHAKVVPDVEAGRRFLAQHDPNLSDLS